jgi:prepilin-type N-terminal cleavage/methylation domain-containing protein
MKQSQKGFTLVELLVVISIIGLLSTLAVVSLGSARSRARDARRISDIRQIQTALELYFADQGIYPVATPAITLGLDNQTDILTENGFENGSSPTGSTVYMGLVPQNFDNPSAIADYEYLSADGTAYDLSFELEGTIAGLTGSLTATPAGIR